MQIDAETVDDILIATPPAMDLDASNADEFKKDIASLVEGKPKVILDLSQVGFMDSAGLGAMLSVFKKVIGGGGRFTISGVQDEVRDLFNLVRIQRLFEIHPDRESAVKSLS